VTVTWRLNYEPPGPSFSSEDGEVWESPEWGAVGVVQPNETRTAREIVGKNGDYLLHRSDLDVWHLVGASGLVDHLAHFGHLIDCIRPTRWMPLDREFKAIWDRMRADAAEADE